MKTFFTLVRILGILVVLAFAGLAIFVASRQHLSYDDTPLPAITASSDSAVVARGRYLVRHVAMCGACHGDPAQVEAVMIGADVPLSGGFEWKIPPGDFYTPNLTPDPKTGIGRYSDGQIARALRDGVGPDGRALLPFMEMQGLATDDITAIISYLRTQPPVPNAVPAHHYTLLGQIVKATVLAKPVGPSSPPPDVAPREPGIETGRYLAGSVANCWACHTQRDNNTGALLNPKFSGNHDFADDHDPNKIWSPPNLTPDPKTGVVARMDEDAFVARMKAGPAIPGTPMPWGAFAGMSEDDLRSIYRFLMSLPPVENEVGPALRTRSS